MRTEGRDHRDEPNNVPVELLKLVRRNPVLPMDARARRPDGELFQILGFNLEAQNMSGAAVARVPVARNLLGILFVQHGIENRLRGQPRRKLPPSAGADQVELRVTNRPI